MKTAGRTVGDVVAADELEVIGLGPVVDLVNLEGDEEKEKD